MRKYVHDTPDLIGQAVTVSGWVHVRRDMGKIIFIHLRDHTGQIQVVIAPGECEHYDVAKELRDEFVVEISGTIVQRGPKQINPDMQTGTIELLAKQLRILNTATTPPFPLENTAPINEEVRLTNRYIDLRSHRMQKNLRLRHAMTQHVRNYLSGEGFIEVETPSLTKGTPEGAREFIVPSRVYPGSFYVLPQSPQQFKQLLMVGGIDRYFQIARCFRDEDQRGDRQAEFTQLDLEMSFVEREDVIALNEALLIDIVKTVAPEKKIQQVPFPRISYAEAMEKYGTDRPDLRDDKNDPNLLAFCWVIDFPFFEKTDEGGWTFTHNPFSAAKPEHHDALLAKEGIGDILTTQYDIVLNGFEIGGGSIRNHQPEALHRVFEIMGFDEDRIQANFGHMLKALASGAPPHGGIAWGFDRFVMILANEPNIREVMAFPKTGDAKDLMMGAPSPLPPSALRDANIQTRNNS
jgi:aspartyl-tRNA synthetase